MYDINSFVIAIVLLVSLVAAIEAGYWVGRKFKYAINDSLFSHINAIQASLLGILALLLGFTFSLALQRHDTRSISVVEEANAIGTAWLRAGLLEAPLNEQASDLIAQYLEQRINAGGIDLAHDEERLLVINESRLIQNELWEIAKQASMTASNQPATALFVDSLNAMFDSLASRNAALERHVPEVVLMLLYGTFLMVGTIVGYAAGVAGHRVSFVSYIMVGLIVMLVFIIIDLDRPRRGLIAVNQDSLLELRQSLSAP